MKTEPALALAPLLATAVAMAAAPHPDQPQELGAVRWGRDLEASLDRARTTGRPALVLFQEIPGCATCVSFGRQPLSHPLLVEAIEDEFVPVAIHNNKPGRDAEVLARFEEPSWNNPVVRFLRPDGTDVIPRRDGVYGAGAVAARMVEALRAAKRPVPGYLDLAALESAAGLESATFEMHCFWEGEARLGALEGVATTRAGWVEGAEVVEVAFDPARLPFDRLLAAARQADCARRVHAHTDEQARRAEAAGLSAQALRTAARDAKPADRRYALERSELRFLPLTPAQATKVNAALRLGEDPVRWLSPRQRDLIPSIRALLARDESALAGLQRPDSIDKLPAYDGELRARLGA